MSYWLFGERFVAPIRAGTKRQTLRKPRERGDPGPGEARSLRAWEGKPYRSGQIDIRPPVVIEAVFPVRFLLHRRDGITAVQVGLTILCGSEFDRFARDDGFPGFREMSDYWRDKYGPAIRADRDAAAFDLKLFRWRP